MTEVRITYKKYTRHMRLLSKMAEQVRLELTHPSRSLQFSRLLPLVQLG